MDTIKNTIQNTGFTALFDNVLINQETSPKIATELANNDIPTFEEIIKELNWFKSIDIEKQELMFTATTDPALKPISQVFAGSAGIGKTVAALLLQRDHLRNIYDKYSEQVAKNKYFLSWNSPKFVRFNHILDLINLRKFGTDEQKSSSFYELEAIKEVKFLVIDDFSSRKAGTKSEFYDTERDLFFQDLFDFRYGNREKFITIITTNDSLQEMQSSNSWIHEKTMSRLLGIVDGRFYESKNKVDKRNN